MSIELAAIKHPDQIRGLSTQELEHLAGDIRRFLLENISRTGGHIGANLGTIELTIALHAVFRSPQEPLLFDTGHQGYTHKLLTGRAHLFPSLNTYNGMSRFLTHHESEHDPIEASHAGTAISVGLGMALSRRLQGNPDRVVAVVGDAAMAEGLSLEALNHAAVEQTGLVVVINDNGYAISPGFGALHNALQDENGQAASLFGSLGCSYIGPVDGHDIAALCKAFESARQTATLPVVHVRTIKGKGWLPADGHPFRQHFSFPFDIESGLPKAAGQAAKTYPDHIAAVLDRRMADDENIVCITPSTIYATGLAGVFQKFPARCFDPGMEEQHALTMTVGMALSGLKPVIAYQSTFLQRAFDQLFHDVCFMNVPVLILSTRSGFSGYDNPTHHGIYDIAYLRAIPNLRVFYPKDGPELERMIDTALTTLAGPSLIMMPYGPADDFGRQPADESDVFMPEQIGNGTDLALITVGNKYSAAQAALTALEASGTRCRLINLRQLKPLPEDAIRESIAGCQRVAVVEEAVVSGGLGADIGAFLNESGISAEFLRIGLPCCFVEPGSNAELTAKYELDGNGIQRRIEKRWPELKS